MNSINLKGFVHMCTFPHKFLMPKMLTAWCWQYINNFSVSVNMQKCMCAKTTPYVQIAAIMNCVNLSVVCFLDSWWEMSTILPVKRNRRRGVHEENGAWWHTLFLQRPLQRVCAWGVWGKGYSNTPTQTIHHWSSCSKMP